MDIVKRIENLVKSLINGEDKPNKLAANIKRQYTLFVQDKIKEGKLNLEMLQRVSEVLLRYYDQIKDYEAINETLELIVQNYKDAKGGTETKAEQKAFEIHTKILGNPGASSLGMPASYVEKIIRNKITSEEGINREDIINLLEQQGQNMYLDIDEYQKLMNGTVISIVDFHISNPNASNLNNPKILKILSDLAKSYKAQNLYHQSKEIYEKALQLTELENTVEYSELKREYDSTIEYIDELDKNFTFLNVKNFDELTELIKKKFNVTIKTEKIFDSTNKKGIRPDGIVIDVDDGELEHDDEDDHDGNNADGEKQPKKPYIMPPDKKLKGLQDVLINLQKENPNITIESVGVGKDEYEGYIIFPLKGTHISIMENFATAKNEALYVIKNENLDQIVELRKRQARQLEGVQPVNHVKNFSNYVRNLTDYVTDFIRQTGDINKEPQPDLEESIDEPINPIDSELTPKPEQELTPELQMEPESEPESQPETAPEIETEPEPMLESESMSIDLKPIKEQKEKYVVLNKRFIQMQENLDKMRTELEEKKRSLTSESLDMVKIQNAASKIMELAQRIEEIEELIKQIDIERLATKEELERMKADAIAQIEKI